MGLGSIHVERAVVTTRWIGGFALILGVGLIVWSVIVFPWHEPRRSPHDWKYTSDVSGDADVQPRLENNMSRFNLPAAESPLNAGPTRFLVDTHESRSAAKETVASCASYIVPGLLLLILSRYLSRIYFWAYICVALLCLGFVAIYVTDLIAMQGFALPIFQQPMLTETLLRPAAVYLFALCLNALPDAREERYRRRRLRRQQGFEPIVAAAPPTRLPPRPTGLVPPSK